MTSSSPPESTDQSQTGLSPPTFSITALLVTIAVLSVLFAAFKLLGPMGGFALTLLVLAVVSHVAGNAIGTRLRLRKLSRNGQETAAGPVIGDDSRSPSGDAAAGSASSLDASLVEQPECAPQTRLHRRDSLGRPIYFVTALGGCVAAALGGYGLARLLGDDATIANVALGVFASGVLGAIWTFIGFSFLQVAVGAVWQASRHK